MPDAYSLLASEQRDQLRSLEQNAENPLLTRKSLGDIQGEFSHFLVHHVFLSE